MTYKSKFTTNERLKNLLHELVVVLNEESQEHRQKLLKQHIAATRSKHVQQITRLLFNRVQIPQDNSIVGLLSGFLSFESKILNPTKSICFWQTHAETGKQSDFYWLEKPLWIGGAHY